MIKDGKIFGKINIFDFIVIVLAILLIFGAFVFFGLKSSGNSNVQLKEVHYEIVLDDIRKETVEGFSVGDAVFGNTSKKQIGIITSLNAKDATTVMETLDGKLISAPVEDKYDLTITIRGIIKTSEGTDMWLSKEDRLLSGQNITFLTQKNKCYGMVKNVEITHEFGEMTEKFETESEKYYSERIKK